VSFSKPPVLRYLLLLLSLLIFTGKSFAQQGRGLFFSTFGRDASLSNGDFNNLQAVYYDIPLDEKKQIHLRVFDPDISGMYDEKYGAFDTETRFIVLGGVSASKIYGGQIEKTQPNLKYNKSDVILDRYFGSNGAGNARWYTLLELKRGAGYNLGNGFERFVLLVLGGKGNDGNFYDLALSHSRTEKINPTTTRSFVYDLSLRIPSLLDYNWTEFQGAITLNTEGVTQLFVNTFDMDDMPISLTVPFKGDIPLSSSSDGNWVENIVSLSNVGNVSEVRFNFFGNDFNNTVGIHFRDQDNLLIPIELPIRNYEEPNYPVAEYKTSYSGDDCNTITFETIITNQDMLTNLETKWYFGTEVITGNKITKRFEGKGYQPFTWEVSALVESHEQKYAIQDSVIINIPPVAWAGGDRANIVNNNMAFDGTISHDPDGKIMSYHWDFGDGTSANGARVDKKYTKNGIYEVTLTVKDDSDSECGTATSKIKVKVNRPPVANIIAPDVVQIGELFTLDATQSQDPDGELIEYAWQIGNDTLIEGPVVRYALNSDNFTKVILQVLDDARTYNSKDRSYVNIRVNKRPIASAGSDKIVSPNRPASFSGKFSRDPDGKIIDYEWYFPDGSIEKGEDVKHAFDKPGTYYVKMRVTDDSQKGFGVDSIQVIVNAPPVAVITENLVFNSGRVILDASNSYDPDGEIIDMFWIVNGNTVNGSKLNTAFNAPGKYSIQHTMIDNSGTYSAVQSKDIEVTVNDLPVPVIEASEHTSPGSPVLFSGVNSTDSDGEIIRYFWDFGDGTVALGKEATHEFMSPGTYQVSLSVQDDLGGVGSTVIANTEVKVNAPPVVKYNFPKRIVSGQEVTLDLSPSYDPDGQIAEYLYFVGDEWIMGKEKQTFVLSGSVSHIKVAVRDRVDQENSETEALIPVVFNQAPVAVAAQNEIRSATPLAYFDGSKSYDSDGDQLKYFWSFGDGDYFEGAMASHKYVYGGLYKAILTVDDQQGLDNSLSSDTVSVFINRPPEVYVELPASICTDYSFVFDASKSYDPDEKEISYSWDFGDGGSSNQAKGSYTFQNEGIYQIELTVNDNEGLENSLTRIAQTVTVVGAPKAYAGLDITACEGEFVSFDGTESKTGDLFNTNFSWDFGDGDKSTGSQVNHNFEKAGTYKVTLTVTTEMPGSCRNNDSHSITVTVIPKPKAEFSIPTTIRTGEVVRFDPSASLVEGIAIKKLTWKIGSVETISYQKATNSVGETRWIVTTSAVAGVSELDDESKFGKLPKFERLLDKGDYTIVLTVEVETNAACKTSEKTMYLTVQDKPILSIQDMPVLVPNVPFQFSGSKEAKDQNVIKAAYWKMGDGTDKQGLFVTHSYSKPGVYTVELLADDGGGGASAVTRTKKDVIVNAPPNAVFDAPDKALPGDALEFNATESYDPDGDIVSYSWFVSDGTRLSGKKVTHRFNKEGTFTITLTVKDNSNVANSTDSESQTIRINEIRNMAIELPGIICVEQPIDILESLTFPTNDSSRVQVYIGSKRITYSEAKNLKFSFAGTYNIRVIYVTGTNAGTTALKHSVIVNGPPEIIATVPEVISIGAVNELAVFDASKSFDPNNDLVRVEWDFGDGKIAFGKIVQYQYSKPGNYKVRLTIIDDKGTECSTVQKTYEVKVIRN